VFFIITFIIVNTLSIATSLSEIKVEILSIVAHGLFGKKTVRVYLADNSFLQKIPKEDSNGLIFVNNCSSAQLIVAGCIKKLSKKCLKKPIFATNYSLYKSKYTIGALFWQKGRPVLILKKEVLLKKHLKVGYNLEKYVQ